MRKKVDIKAEVIANSIMMAVQANRYHTVVYNTERRDFNHSHLFLAAKDGYEKAREDIISLIESRIAEILGDTKPKPILRTELQNLIDKIKEEE